MIKRGARLLAALSGAEERDAELSSLAQALNASGLPVRDIADTVVAVLEEHDRDAPKSGGPWGPATALAACFAAVGGGLGLRAMVIFLLPGDAAPSWILPLFALPLAVYALFRSLQRARERSAEHRERFAVSLSLALARIGMEAKLALRTGIVTAGLDAERAGLMMRFEPQLIAQLAVRKSQLAVEHTPRLVSKAAPALAAVWAVAAFWILYFSTVTESMLRGLPE